MFDCITFVCMRLQYNKPIHSSNRHSGTYRVSTVSGMKRQREDEISYCLLSRNNNETNFGVVHGSYEHCV